MFRTGTKEVTHEKRRTGLLEEIRVLNNTGLALKMYSDKFLEVLKSSKEHS